MDPFKNNADHATVRLVAEQLMESNGTTTTLEVKNQLRNQGFWAYQANISAMMDELACLLGWQYEYCGRFRRYFKAKTAGEQQDPYPSFRFSAN